MCVLARLFGEYEDGQTKAIISSFTFENRNLSLPRSSSFLIKLIIKKRVKAICFERIKKEKSKTTASFGSLKKPFSNYQEKLQTRTTRKR